jgi:HK97 family phage major capsid protein
MSQEDKAQELMQAVKELRATLELKNQDSSETKEKISNIEKFLDDQEKKNQARVAADAEKHKKEVEFNERLAGIEKSLTRVARSGDKSVEVADSRKAFEQLVRFGEKGVEAEYTKYLRTDVATAGGYLAPPEYINEILKQIVEISPVRAVSRVRTTTKKAILIPTRTGTPTAQWVDEGGSMSATQSTYGMKEIPTSKLVAEVVISLESLNDSAFDMQSEINQDVIEQFSYAEGVAFLTGDGVSKPDGILSDTTIQATNSGDANLLTADSLITVAGTLKTGYNPMYMFNRRTLAAIRKFKGADGHYIWTPSLEEGAPNMINGEPYVIANDVPDIAAGAYPVLYGDFLRGYTIVDNIMMSVVRDDLTQARQSKIVFYFRKGLGGQVVMSEAIKKIIIAA